jgi:hypothetical protein
VAQIIDRTLAAEPADRYQTAVGLKVAWEQAFAAATGLR